jgi:hypothetical protein
MKIEHLEPSSDAEALCRKLIRDNGLNHTLNEIRVYLATKPSYSKGELVRANTRLCSEVERMIHDSNLLAWIVVDQGYWLDYPDRREPLLFHELSKIWYDEEKNTFTLRKPGIAEFPEVIQKYGDWSGDFIPVRDHLEKASTLQPDGDG